jgi:RimJ/RimL family protein N-acetyltransferase
VDAARFRIDWATDVGALAAAEPTADEVATHVAALARGYNDPRNARLMGHDEPFEESEVAEHYRLVYEEGGRAFLLYRDGALIGDADLRNVTTAGTSARPSPAPQAVGPRSAGDGAAEFAFMIAAPTEQGKGLGTKFAVLVHAFAFAQLGLRHVFASIVPENVASRRVFDKLGYVVDASPAARAFAENPSDVVMSIAREAFEREHRASLAAIRITKR